MVSCPGYHLGLACALAVGGSGVRESVFVGEVLERATRAFGSAPTTG